VSENVPTFPLLPRRRVGGLSFGTMRSRARGSGHDLAGARPYRPGDDVRRIDWRASARLSTARGVDEFVVRQHHSVEATRVVIVVDRSPSMGLYPGWSPWLSKPRAIVEAGELILASALRAGCLVGYLDDADARHPLAEKRLESPFWRAPGGTTDPWRIRERYLRYEGFHAPAGAVAAALAHLSAVESPLPPGSFVFVVSDFLSCPAPEEWEGAVGRGWDLVPVVVQDPVWERSFPDVAGAIVPFADPDSGHASFVRLGRAAVAERRAANEERVRALEELFEGLGLDPVHVASSDRGDVLGAFRDWAFGRHQGARLAR
jgi:hypothetical protein